MSDDITEQPWYKRLLVEQEELKKKADDLLAFLQSGKAEEQLTTQHFTLLNEQWDAMMHYYTILGTRLELLEADWTSLNP